MGKRNISAVVRMPTSTVPAEPGSDGATGLKTTGSPTPRHSPKRAESAEIAEIASCHTSK